MIRSVLALLSLAGAAAAQPAIPYVRANPQVVVRSGTIGQTRIAVLSRTITAAGGNMELTTDGAAPTAANTIPLPANSAKSVKPVRYVVRNPATGWTAVYVSQEVLGVKAATAASVSITPTTPTFSLLLQLGTPQGNFAFNIYADTTGGRVAFFALTDAAGPLTVTADVQTVETP